MRPQHSNPLIEKNIYSYYYLELKNKSDSNKIIILTSSSTPLKKSVAARILLERKHKQ
jgi:hypothetical protein